MPEPGFATRRQRGDVRTPRALYPREPGRTGTFEGTTRIAGAGCLRGPTPAGGGGRAFRPDHRRSALRSEDGRATVGVRLPAFARRAGGSRFARDGRTPGARARASGRSQSFGSVAAV